MVVLHAEKRLFPAVAASPAAADGSRPGALAEHSGGSEKPCGPASGGLGKEHGVRPAPVVAAVPARVVPVPADQKPERVALEALLAGPTDQERQAGYLSSFGSSSRGVAFEAEIRSDGTALVNFDQAIRDHAKAFVSNIDARQVVATLSQFPGVERVLILVEGDPLCRALGEC